MRLWIFVVAHVMLTADGWAHSFSHLVLQLMGLAGTGNNFGSFCSSYRGVIVTFGW